MPGIGRTPCPARADDGERPETPVLPQSKGVAMKATLTALAALLVTTFPLNPAKAQSPDEYQAMQAGFKYTGYEAGPVEGAPAAGCDSCGGKKDWLAKLGLKKGGCDGCGKLGWLKKGGCDGKCGCGGGPIKQWLCK